jgi:hypothetical protein
VARPTSAGLEAYVHPKDDLPGQAAIAGAANEMRVRAHARGRRWLVTVVAVLAVTTSAAAPALAGRGGTLRIEPGWYDGHAVSFLQPSLFSSNPNGGVLACFGLGPDLAGIVRPTQPLYVIFDDTATQDHCDGQPDALRHDHILPVAPGDSGYTGAWTLVLLVEATPGSIDLATNPITSAAEVQAALTSGSLIDVTAALAPGGPVRMIAPVIGGR